MPDGEAFAARQIGDLLDLFADLSLPSLTPTMLIHDDCGFSRKAAERLQFLQEDVRTSAPTRWLQSRVGVEENDAALADRSKCPLQPGGPASSRHWHWAAKPDCIVREQVGVLDQTDTVSFFVAFLLLMPASEPLRQFAVF